MLISTRRGKKSDTETEALGRSRGGFSTKVSVVCDALGNPLAFRLLPGQRHEITQAEALLEEALRKKQLSTEVQRQELRAVLGDKGFDSSAFVAYVEGLGAEAVIPAKKNRNEPREIDRELYKDRNKVERFFGRIKHYRRLATRYDKSALSYASFLHVACIMTPAS